jgi:hypothetical protein
MVRTIGLVESHVISVEEELDGLGALLVGRDAEGDASELDGLVEGEVQDELLIGVGAQRIGPFALEQVGVVADGVLVETEAAAPQQAAVDVGSSPGRCSCGRHAILLLCML